MLYENIEYADDSVVRFGNSNSKLVLKNESDAHGGFNGFSIITPIEKPYNRTEHSQGFFIC